MRDEVKIKRQKAKVRKPNPQRRGQSVAKNLTFARFVFFAVSNLRAIRRSTNYACSPIPNPRLLTPSFD